MREVRFLRKFYHVDSSRIFAINNVIYPKSQITLKNLRTYQLSNHGYNYMNYENKNGFYELLYEIIRFEHFPSKISRLESLFAFETLTEAMEFIEKYRKQYKCNILEVESDNYEILDMKWLKGGNCKDLYDECFSYWSGDISDDPIKECLLKLPVRINNVIEVK